MLSNTLRATRARALSVSPRFLHNTPVAALQTSEAGRDRQLSQGNVSKPRHDHPGDPHDQAARAGQRAQQQGSGPHDAASPVGNKKAASDLTGNREKVGFAEQVGSSASSADKDSRPSSHEGKGAKEESTPPGLFASLKSTLGFDTSSGEVKQNRGGGVGVTGTGALPLEKKPQDGRRPYHTSAPRAADATTHGQAPDSSRQPKETTNAEQNPHLKHKVPGKPDEGKGNAGDDPKLPSKSHEKSPSPLQQRRSFSTSTRHFEKHTADSYFKDVDQAPASSEKTHQVDNSSTGADVQRPAEPLTGEFSRAGAQTEEYRTVSEEDKYDTPPSSGPEKDQKSRYGNMPEYNSSGESGESVSKQGEGPEGASKGGRKPEGRS